MSDTLALPHLPARSQTGVGSRVLTVGLTAAAGILLAYATATTRLVLNDYGLIFSFGPAFYAAMLCLIIGAVYSWYSTEDWALWIVQFTLLVYALYLFPALLEGGPRPRWVYGYYGWTDYVMRLHHIQPWGLTYHSWPGLFLLMGALLQALGVNNPPGVMLACQFLIPLSFAAPLYVLAKHQGWRPAVFWGILWFFTAADWLDQTNYQASAQGFFLYFLFIALFLRRRPGTVRAGVQATEIVTVLVGLALVLTHFATALTGMSAMVLLVWADRDLRRTGLIFALLLIVLFLAWNVYGAQFILDRELSVFLHALFRLDRSFSTNLLDRLAGSFAHQVVVRVKLAFAALTALFAFAAFLASRNRPAPTDRAFVALAVAPLVMLFVPIYLGEDYTRMWMFMLIGAAYFAAKPPVPPLRQPVFITFLIVAVPLSLLTHYGSDSYDVFRPGEWAAEKTFYRTTGGGTVIGGFPLAHSSYMERYELSFWPQVAFIDGEIRPAAGGGRPFDPSRPQYIAVGRGDRDLFKLFENQPGLMADMVRNLMASTHYALVYDSADLTVFVRRPR